MGRLDESIVEAGGLELATHYPDCGPIGESNWHKAVLNLEKRQSGRLGWLWSFLSASQPCLAVLSANDDGLRIFVALSDFAIFIPWCDLDIDAIRGWPASMVKLTTNQVPQLDLVCELDDQAADELFGRFVDLPQRDPPRTLAWEFATSWGPIIALLLIAFGVILGIGLR